MHDRTLNVKHCSIKRENASVSGIVRESLEDFFFLFKWRINTGKENITGRG